MVPHSIVTVSLATAMLPRLSSCAADADLRGVAAAWPPRCARVRLIVPFALLLPVIAPRRRHVDLGYGAGRDERAGTSRSRWRCSARAWCSSPPTT